MSEEQNIEDAQSEAGDGLKPSTSPALVINVQSWATPVVGLLMLVVGLLAGYFIHPLIAERFASETPIAAAPANTPAGEVPSAANPTSQATAAQAPANLQELMDYMVPQLRHIKGDPEAAVTIIEFSDFQ